MMLGVCDIEFWRATDDEPEVLRSRRWNPVTQRASVTSFRAPAFGNLHQFDECVFPVDIVITWVNGRDPAWIGRKNHHLAAMKGFTRGGRIFGLDGSFEFDRHSNCVRPPRL